mmetsp:Transcript_137174/g.438658  ORF Transcript_137174/g.438658 Transcript_137174/m.438658 type:complete len:214 (+) Transcript_137174:619-1260(+)
MSKSNSQPVPHCWLLAISFSEQIRKPIAEQCAAASSNVTDPRHCLTSFEKTGASTDWQHNTGRTEVAATHCLRTPSRPFFGQPTMETTCPSWVTSVAPPVFFLSLLEVSFFNICLDCELVLLPSPGKGAGADRPSECLPVAEPGAFVAMCRWLAELLPCAESDAFASEVAPSGLFVSPPSHGMQRSAPESMPAKKNFVLASPWLPSPSKATSN